MVLPTNEFQKYLLEALNSHHPTWSARHNYKAQDEPPLGVWSETLVSWVNGERFPQQKAFQYFLSKCVFPNETKNTLEELHNKELVTRKLASEVSSTVQAKRGKEIYMKPSGMPTPATPFIERHDSKRITELLKSQASKIVTIVGLPGAGKSRLAIHCAELLLNDGDFDEAFFVSLETVEQISHIILKVSAAVGTKIDEQQEIVDQLTSVFPKDKNHLIVIDNFEHLISGANILSEIVNSISNVKLLVTSQTPLRLNGEQIYALEGLNFDVAKQLFISAATRIKEDFELKPNEEKFIYKLWELVDKLPLAMELAATWVELLSCEEIVTEIQMNLDFLETDLINVPERQKSIIGSLDYAIGHLNPEQKLAFSKLCIFKDKFDRKAAQEITEISLTMFRDLSRLPLIRGFVNGLYEIPNTLKRHGAKLLEDSGTFAIYQKYSLYYIEMLIENKEKIETNEQDSVIELIEQSIENIVYAIELTLATTHNINIGNLIEAFTTLAIYYDTQSQAKLAQELFERAAKNLESVSQDGNGDALFAAYRYATKFNISLSNYEKAQENLQKMRRLVGAESNLQLASLHEQSGKLYYDQGEYTRAKSEYTKSLTILRQNNEADQIASVLTRLGDIELVFGNYANAIKHVREAIKVKQDFGETSEGDKRGIGIAKVTISSESFYKQGEYKKAIKELESAKTYFPSNDKLWKGIILINQAKCCLLLENIEKALDICDSAIELFEELESEWQIRYAKNIEARIWFASGDVEDALSLFKKNLHPNHSFHRTYTLVYMGYCYLELGELKKSLSVFCEAIKIREAPKFLEQEVICGIATYMVKAGQRYEDALTLGAFVNDSRIADAETKERSAALITTLKNGKIPEDVVDISLAQSPRGITEIIELASSLCE